VLNLGPVHLRPYSDFSQAHIEPASSDRLVAGNGTVNIKLTGADFEFVEKVELQKVAARASKPAATTFELPEGARHGEQRLLNVDVDTATPGAYRLLLAQSDGVSHTIAVSVLPPNPKLASLPVHVNLGEDKQTLRLEGSGLQRIEAITSDAGTITGAADQGEWSGTIHLKSEARAGQRFSLALKVSGLNAPIAVPDAILVVGPRPKILSIRKSLPQELGVEIRENELPAGISVGVVMAAGHLSDPPDETVGEPRLALSCRSGELRKPLTLSPDEHAGSAALSFAGPDSLYLSLDPGQVGYPGCELAASVTVEPKGSSDAFVLGRVVRIPLLDRFTLSGETLGPNTYAGVLMGRHLDVIEKAGWDARNGLPVAGIPTPVPGDPSQQTLRIAVPWPAPAPHAPLYIWLRGEQAGRRTNVSE
jgi:hypothetical protein